MVIQPIVEGDGEIQAVPVLLRRLQSVAECYGFEVARPIKRNRSEFANELAVRRFVQLALRTPDCAGILIVFDSDDDPACTIGPNVPYKHGHRPKPDRLHVRQWPRTANTKRGLSRPSNLSGDREA